MQQATSHLTAEQLAFVNKFSIGALLFPQGYFFAVNSIRDGFLLFVPVYNIYVWLRGAFKGRRRSWETGEWKSFASYERRQKTMDKAGIIVLVAIIALYALMFVLFAGAAMFISTSTVEQGSRDYRADQSYDSAVTGGTVPQLTPEEMRQMEELQERIRAEYLQAN